MNDVDFLQIYKKEPPLSNGDSCMSGSNYDKS